MENLSFFSVLRSNLKCAVCKDKKCPVRYMPQRRKVQLYDGHRFITSCKKDEEKQDRKTTKNMKRIFKKLNKKDFREG